MNYDEFLSILGAADKTFAERFGSEFITAFLQDFNTSRRIGEELVYALENCSEGELKIADSVLVAVCGLTAKELLERV
jgi:hypothetical protein